MQGLHEVAKTVKVYEPKAVTATLTDYNGHSYTTGNASGIDIQGYDELKCVLSLGAIAGGSLTVTLMHSETDDGTAAAVFTDQSSNNAAFDAKTSANQNNVYIIRARAKDMKRYLFVRVVNSSADSKLFGINLELAKADKEPVTQENTVDFNHINA